tara:strand:+ start:182 stop:721 length:540 start_codon:yes stop_codon:yes gene_type:complete
MDLKELQKMIKEEWYSFKEQEGEPTTIEPAVAVSDDDIDAMGGDEDAEATLRQIYDMLDAYFNAEGGDAAAAAAGDDMDMDDEEMADMADDMEDDDEEVSEGPGGSDGCGPLDPCPPHQVCRNGKCTSESHLPDGGKKEKGGSNTDKSKKSSKKSDKKDKEDKEDLKERFQKLANIIKG